MDSSSQEAAGWLNAAITTSSTTRALTINDDNGSSGSYDTADSGEAPDDTVYMNSSTNLYVIDDDGDLTIVEGYDDIKGYLESTAVDGILVFYDGSVVNDIFVFGGTWTTEGTYALYIGKYTTSSDTYYRFYLDGATVAYTSSVDDTTMDAMTTRSLYKLEVSSGDITKIDLEMAYGAAEEVIRSRTDYFTTSDGTFYYDDDVVVYDYTEGNAEATLSGGDYVVYALEDGMVAAIYIVTDPASTGEDTSSNSDITISAARIGGSDGRLLFTASPSGKTVYVVVEYFANSGYTTLLEVSCEITGAEQAVSSRAYTAGDYRVYFYADENHEELIDTFYLESTYAGA